MMGRMTLGGGRPRTRKAAPTEQTNFVTLSVVLHEKLVSSADVGIEVPESVE